MGRAARRNAPPRRGAHEDKSCQRQVKWPYMKSNAQTLPYALQFVGRTQEGTIHERIAKLLDAILGPMEAEWTNGNGDGHVVARVKRLRSAILPDMIKGGLTADEKARRWRLLEDADVAQQLYHYPAEYVTEKTSKGRILETVERFEEDLTGKVRVHGPVEATLTVGDAIEVQAGREARDESVRFHDEGLRLGS